LRAALFVDFDNMCISFEELDPLAAHRFATQPARWLAWFESGLHALNGGGDADAEPVRRRILVRKCYLNPVTFGRYRSDYTRAAFTVVDCPPLTQRGKTSADVYMVMDSPRRARAQDRVRRVHHPLRPTPTSRRCCCGCGRTTATRPSWPPTSPRRPTRPPCDLIVPYERFFEEALGIEEEPAGLPHLEQAPTLGGSVGGGDYEALLPRVARALKERVAAAGPLGPREVPATFATFPEFRNSDWFGRFSLKGLMGRLLELEPGLWMLGDPNAAWSVRLRDVAPPTPRRPRGTVRRAAADGPGFAGEVRPTDVPRTRRPGRCCRPRTRRRVAPDHRPARPRPRRGGGGRPPCASSRRIPTVFFRRVADATGVPALTPPSTPRLFAAVADAAVVPDLDFNGRAGQIRDALQADGMQSAAPR
jgi:hypothetical protein